jgi:hypothetical protein
VQGLKVSLLLWGEGSGNGRSSFARPVVGWPVVGLRNDGRNWVGAAVLVA